MIITRPEEGNLYIGYRNRIAFNYELGLLRALTGQQRNQDHYHRRYESRADVNR